MGGSIAIGSSGCTPNSDGFFFGPAILTTSAGGIIRGTSPVHFPASPNCDAIAAASLIVLLSASEWTTGTGTGADGPADGEWHTAFLLAGVRGTSQGTFLLRRKKVGFVGSSGSTSTTVVAVGSCEARAARFDRGRLGLRVSGGIGTLGLGELEFGVIDFGDPFGEPELGDESPFSFDIGIEAVWRARRLDATPRDGQCGEAEGAGPAGCWDGGLARAPSGRPHDDSTVGDPPPITRAFPLCGRAAKRGTGPAAACVDEQQSLSGLDGSDILATFSAAADAKAPVSTVDALRAAAGPEAAPVKGASPARSAFETWRRAGRGRVALRLDLSLAELAASSSMFVRRERLVAASEASVPGPTSREACARSTVR